MACAGGVLSLFFPGESPRAKSWVLRGNEWIQRGYNECWGFMDSDVSQEFRSEYIVLLLL